MEDPTEILGADTGQDVTAGEARSVTVRGISSAAAPPERSASGRQRASMTDPSYGLNRASHRAHVVLLVSTCVIGMVVIATAITAVTLLATTPGGTSWDPILQEIVKVSYQALAVGALGGLAKLLLDRRRDREAQDNELRERRHRYITIVVAASHQIDNAQLAMSANRSVLTWTTIVNNDLIPARTQLRQLTHSLRNWTQAGRPVFGAKEDVIADHLESMYYYLGDLVEEYAAHKTRLSEIQRSAEKAEGQARTKLLAEIWDEIRGLTLFGDYVDDGDCYAEYRNEYLGVLREMRSSLAGS
jgi:hypothetical protein